jgi:hypothetical protein
LQRLVSVFAAMTRSFPTLDLVHPFDIDGSVMRAPVANGGNAALTPRFGGATWT